MPLMCVNRKQNENELPPRREEVRKCIPGLKVGISLSADEITAGMKGSGGEELEAFLVSALHKIMERNELPEDLVNSVSVPIPKKMTSISAVTN